MNQYFLFLTPQHIMTGIDGCCKVTKCKCKVVLENVYFNSTKWSVGSSKVVLGLRKLVSDISMSHLPPTSSAGVFVGSVHGWLLVSYVWTWEGWLIHQGGEEWTFTWEKRGQIRDMYTELFLRTEKRSNCFLYGSGFISPFHNII